MEQIERIGKTGRIFEAFETNNFAGMTLDEIQNATCILKSDLLAFFEKHNENSDKQDKYICKCGKYYLLSECR